MDDQLQSEKLFESFSVWAEAQLKDTPVAKSLILTVDWGLGNENLPIGGIVGQERSLNSMLRCVDHTFKTSLQLLHQFGRDVSEEIKKCMAECKSKPASD